MQKGFSAILLLVFLVVLAVGGYVYYQSQGGVLPSLKPALQSSPESSPQPSSQASNASSHYASWEPVIDDSLKMKFKIPQEQSYVLAQKKISPAEIFVKVNYDYGGGSRREFIKKAYKLKDKDMKVEEYTTAKGRSALLIDIEPQSYMSDQFDYIGVVVNGPNLFIFNGKPKQKELIKGILDTLEFTGAISLKNDMVQCMKFDPKQDNAFGRNQNGDYFYSLYVTKKLDKSYLVKEGTIRLEAYSYSDPTLKHYPVKFLLELLDYNNPPYAQEIHLIISEEEVKKQLGAQNIDPAKGVVFSLTYSSMKTSDGKYCSEGGIKDTTPIL